MSFVMYSTTWCGYCKRLKSQLADLGVTFEEINIEEVEGTAEIVEKANGGNRTVPTLVFSDGAVMTNPSAKEVVEKLASLSAKPINALPEVTCVPSSLSMQAQSQSRLLHRDS